MRLPEKKRPGNPVLASDWNLLIEAVAARTPRPSPGVELVHSSGGFLFRLRPVAASSGTTAGPTCRAFYLVVSRTYFGDSEKLWIQIDISVAWEGESEYGTGTRRYRRWDGNGDLVEDTTQAWGVWFPSLGFGELIAADGSHVETGGTEHFEDPGSGLTRDTEWRWSWSDPLGFRIRWTVPEEHGGSWFLVVWDEMFTPDDDEEAVVLTERSAEWEAPADKELPWQPPAPRPGNAVGCVEPANVRFSCYRSPAGQKPQFDHGFPIHP